MRYLLEKEKQDGGCRPVFIVMVRVELSITGHFKL